MISFVAFSIAFGILVLCFSIRHSDLVSCLIPVGDDKLQTWAKMESPILPLPPPNMPLVGWRDPFVFQQGGNGNDWIILMGSGIKGEGGAVLVYKTQNLKAGIVIGRCLISASCLLCLADYVP